MEPACKAGLQGTIFVTSRSVHSSLEMRLLVLSASQ